MSTGGGFPHLGLMLEAAAFDLDMAWIDREKEAASLTAAGFLSMAISFRMYGLEIRIKSLICRHLKLKYLPRVCKTHDLMDLIIYSGLWTELDETASEEVCNNWDLLAKFSKKRLNDLRYQPGSSFDPTEFAKLASALDDPTQGILAWLSKHP